MRKSFCPYHTAPLHHMYTLTIMTTAELHMASLCPALSHVCSKHSYEHAVRMTDTLWKHVSTWREHALESIHTHTWVPPSKAPESKWVTEAQLVHTHTHGLSGSLVGIAGAVSHATTSVKSESVNRAWLSVEQCVKVVLAEHQTTVR